MNLAFLVYTNQNNLPILKLFLDFFLKYNNLELKLYVVCNDYLDQIDIDNKNIIKLNAQTTYKTGGEHFSQTLSKVIDQIEERYIFYFCDDYMITKEFDTNTLCEVLNMIDNEEVDLFSFATHECKKFKRPNFNIDYKKYNLGETIFYELNNSDYIHVFSVQPCIWNKQSLKSLLIDNPDMSLHDLDCSRVKNKEKYKVIGTDFSMNDCGQKPNPYIFDYKEIIRHGVFFLNLNGCFQPKNNHIETFILSLIKEKKLINNEEYKKYILFTEEQLENYV